MFPMGVSELRDRLGWWSPDPRGILPLDGLRVTRSMRQSAKRFEIRVDTCFTRVMRACADPSRGPTWISEEFIEGYTRLHELGWAHSVEVFDRSSELVGGLYGVRIAGLFLRRIDVSHRARRIEGRADGVGRSHAVERDDPARRAVVSEHLASLGAIAIPRSAYLARLAAALRKPTFEQLRSCP